MKTFAISTMLLVACGRWAAAQSSDHGLQVTPRRLTTDGYFKQRPVWSPDGKRLVFARHEGDTIRLYVAEAGRSRGNSRSPHRRDAGATGAIGAAATPHALSALRRLTGRDLPEYDAVWSPDGKRLAFTLIRQSGTQGDLDVYTVADDGSDLKPVAVTQGKLSHEESPAWSPDGKRIAFTSTREGNQEIYVAAADGSTLTRLTRDPALDAHPAWSPDGKQIVFATARWGDLEIAAMAPDGSNVTRLTDSEGLDDYPTFSPDGRQVAFTTNRDANFEIYLMTADGKHPRNLTRSRALDNFPAWHPDGAHLSFVSNRTGASEIYWLRVTR